MPQANERHASASRVPIDIPFTEVSRLLEAQIAGKTFPEDGSGSFATTIKQAAIAASGDRLLISLLVNVKKRGLFVFGADATVHVWGRPVLDQDHQILRFTDVALDVQSKAAFGLLGAAAQAAAPYLQKALAEKAVIDLKPFAADAKKRIAAAVGDFAAQGRGFSANVAVNDLRLAGIAYDDKTLRIIANANGTVNVAISSLADAVGVMPSFGSKGESQSVSVTVLERDASQRRRDGIKKTPGCRSARGRAPARGCRGCPRRC